MAMKATEQFIDALSQLLQAFTQLQEEVEEEYGSEEDNDDVESEANPDVESGLITEIRSAIESVIETDDYGTDDFAALISTFTESLEEIDPDIFESDDDDEEEEEDDDDEEYDDIDDDEEYEEEDDDDEEE
jgi:hypothetical protein